MTDSLCDQLFKLVGFFGVCWLFVKDYVGFWGQFELYVLIEIIKEHFWVPSPCI